MDTEKETSSVPIHRMLQTMDEVGYVRQCIENGEFPVQAPSMILLTMSSMVALMDEAELWDSDEHRDDAIECMATIAFGLRRSCKEMGKEVLTTEEICKRLRLTPEGLDVMASALGLSGAMTHATADEESAILH